MISKSTYRFKPLFLSFARIVVAIALIFYCAINPLTAQTQQEENLWEEILGAPDNNTLIQLLNQYIDEYCSGSNNGTYCTRAKAQADRLQSFKQYSIFEKCANIVDLFEKADCIKSRLIEFPNDADLLRELNNLENQLWLSIITNSETWKLDNFKTFREIYETGVYTSKADDIIQFLQLGDELEARIFFSKHVEGMGRDKLKYFETLHNGKAIVLEAKKQAEQLENIVWQSDKKKNTETSLRHYIKFYPNGRYLNEAKGILALIVENQESLGDKLIDEIEWAEIVSTSADPEVVRGFINDYPESIYYSEATRLYGKLDDKEWLKSKDISSEFAYRNYINLFPNGKYVEEAKQILPKLINDEEDILWESTLSEASIQNFREFLNKYPNSKYRVDAKRNLSKLLESEYSINQKGGQFEIKILNASNIRIIEQSSDSIVADVIDYDNNIIEAAIIHSGRHHFTVADENNKEIIVYLSDLIDIDIFKIENDSLIMLVEGGLKPYLILFEDTTFNERRKPLTREFDSESIELAKNEIIELMDAGVYSVLIRDNKRKNTAIAGVIDLSQSIGDLVSKILMYSGILIGFFLLWFFLQNKVLKKKSIYDQESSDDDWD